MKAWRRCCMGLVMVVVSGCGDNGNGTTAEEWPEPEQPSDIAAEPAAEPIEEPASIDPLVVEMRASASLRPDRRLMVEGETNLPDETRLLIVVERELSGVRWQSRTVVSEGRFGTGPFGPGSGLPDGGYIITVNLVEASIQPLPVRERIGDEGQHLEGELVRTSRHGLGQVASYARRYLIGNEPRRATDNVEVLEVE